MAKKFNKKIAEVGILIKDETDLLKLIKEFNGEGYFVPASNLVGKVNKVQKEPKKKITIEEFWASKERLAIHTPNDEEARTLCQIFGNMDKKWFRGRKFSKNHNNYDDFEDKTCYSNDCMHCDVYYYTKNNIPIYEFKEVDFGKWLDETKAEEAQAEQPEKPDTAVQETDIDDFESEWR